jgi:hypothetical protein
MPRCSGTRRRVERRARERDAKVGRVCLTWKLSLTFPLYQALACTKLDAGEPEGSNDHRLKVV